jgi:indolepyruvate ferredoxin oxidoreductase
MPEAIASEMIESGLRSISLADRFKLRSGPVLISGVQALVRLMLVQADRDRDSGLSTGGFVSGYRGSPLGTLDTTFNSVAALTKERYIVVRPAVNEEMAATAIAGSQQIAQSPGAKVDGVFALWYGKGPGLDRASDAIRHGNYQGASPHGGVVLAVGDDHVAKSSSIVCYSDDMVAGLQVPLFYPADGREIVEYGLHGFAMSRHTGSWVALKILTEVADASRTVATDELAIAPTLPEIAIPPSGLYNRWPDTAQDQEIRQIEYRLPAIAAYVHANGLDRIVSKATGARIGLVAAGKSWLDLREALDLLGVDEGRLATLGVALYKPAMIWPLEPQRLAEFAEGLETIVVVEEKGAFVERQIKEILYRGASAPEVWGKHGPDRSQLFPATGDLTPERIAAELVEVLRPLDNDGRIVETAERWRTALVDQKMLAVPPALRKPFFCSGCPHNRSTVLPEGSRATAGIGCHGMAAFNRPATSSFAQMGGEGVHWMGLAPFTDEKHMFANMGDGTYFHSGLLAVRQAVAADLNITYKLLYNSAVAMTGGQSVDGELSVERVVGQLRAEGVKRIVISTDDPDRYSDNPVRSQVLRIEHRDDLEALQRELRDLPGVSVIVYEQMCATEKRRLRKRGKLEDPTKRIFINDLVCEGCGDCSVKSNCLSVEPIETPLGTKRRINQSTCNKDYSCLTGFCPSFVTVDGGTPRKRTSVDASALAPLTEPTPFNDIRHERILVAGVGGTGVVTIGALLVMAAHMSGRRSAVLDQVGLAQKGGAVTSHIHVAKEPIHALRIVAGQADLVLACDQIVGNAKDVMAAIEMGRTWVIANADVSITGDFTQDRNARADVSLLTRRLSQRAGSDHFLAYPFTRLAEILLGDAIGSNLMMLGVAYQKGWVRLDLQAFKAAVELNGTAVKMNLAAFDWGRRLAVDPQAVFQAAGLADPELETLDQLIARYSDFLVAYQNETYAARFRTAVDRVRAAEAAVSTERVLTSAAARSLFRLMAYKDEYEVARLYSDGSFKKAVAEQFEGETKLSFHLAPPVWARRDKATGHQRKIRFGSWMMPGFRVLAAMKRLRGTPLDLFGYTHERRIERALIGEYEQLLDWLIANLVTGKLSQAAAVAGLAGEVRGYGHVKDAAIERYRTALAAKLADYDRAAVTPDGRAPAQQAESA